MRSDGTVVLLVRGGWSAGVLRDIRDETFDRLSIGGGKWPDFQPLGPFASKIKGLSVTSSVGSFAGIEKLGNLLTLELDDAPSPPPELLNFKKLRACYLKWHPKYPPEFFTLPALRDVTLAFYSGVDCSGPGRAVHLQELDVRYSRLASLHGLEKARTLRRLSLSDLRSLSDISAIAGLKRLEVLSVENCPRIVDATALAGLTSLRELSFDAPNAKFADLSWLKRFSALTDLAISGTVANPNWDVLFKLPKLSTVSINSHAGYRIDEEELVAKATSARRKIVELSRTGKKGSTFSFTLGRA